MTHRSDATIEDVKQYIFEAALQLMGVDCEDCHLRTEIETRRLEIRDSG